MLRIIIVLLTAAQCVTAQIVYSPNAFNEKGQKEGQWTLFFDEDWKRVESPAEAAYFRIIHYKDGRPAGIVRDYYLSGVLQWEGLIVIEEGDISHGHVVYYHPNGRKSSEGEKVYDIPEGEWTSWYPDGRLLSKGSYSNGQRYGTWIHSFESNTFAIGSYLLDRAEGEWIYYQLDSTISEKGMYRNGLREGVWYIRGKEDGWIEAMYATGKMNGLCTIYHASGAKAAEGPMIEEKKHGTWTYWNSDSVKIGEETLQHGVLHGPARYWDDDGTLSWEGEYEYDKRKTFHGSPNGRFGSLRRL